MAPLVEVDADEVVRRVSGRRLCRECSTLYNEVTAPPKQPGVCDDDGSELYQRDDDKPEVVRERLVTFERDTAPVIDYYAQQGK